MEHTILVFGALAEIVGDQRVQLGEVANTAELRARLVELYPPLAQITFAIAVNKQIVQEEQPLLPHCEIALLPPFSGG